MDIHRGPEIPVLKEAFKEHENVHETAAFQDENDAQPGFIGDSPSENATLIKEGSVDNGYGSNSNNATPDSGSTNDVGTYPPGLSLNGSSNLPVPPVDSNLITKPKSKKKKKRSKVSSDDDDAKATSSPGSESPKQNRSTSDKSANSNPLVAPKTLPPITKKTLGNAIMPITYDVTKLEPIGKGNAEKIEDKEGVSNTAFVSDEHGDHDGKGIDMSFVNINLATFEFLLEPCDTFPWIFARYNEDSSKTFYKYVKIKCVKHLCKLYQLGGFRPSQAELVRSDSNAVARASKMKGHQAKVRKHKNLIDISKPSAFPSQNFWKGNFLEEKTMFS